MPAKLSKAVLLLLAVSAVQPTQAEPSAAPSFNDVYRVLRNNCIACHNAADPQGGLILTRDVAPGNLVDQKAVGANAPLVAPGKPEESYLLAKMLGTHAEMDGSGFQMPISGQLRDDEIEVVRQWIGAGAK